jgi:hypothetical protein
VGKMLEATRISERRACALVGLARDSWRHPPDVAHGDAFLHLNPRAPSWPADGWRLSELLENKVIEYRGCDRDGTGASDFESYGVKDWRAFAMTLGLRGD